MFFDDGAKSNTLEQEHTIDILWRVLLRVGWGRRTSAGDQAGQPKTSVLALRLLHAAILVCRGPDLTRTKLIAPNDQRVRVGRERREKMQKRLLSAVMSSYASHKSHFSFGIDDVVQEAGVSRATFYLYFDSLEAAVDKLGQELIDEMNRDMEMLVARNDDPLSRMATGIQAFLLRSVTDPMWGAFVSRTQHFASDVTLLAVVESDLLKARELKMVEFTDVEAASSLLLGSTMEAVRRLVSSDQPKRAYVEELTVMILRGLGVDVKRGTNLAHDRAMYIRGLAPDCIPWWKDPWTRG